MRNRWVVLTALVVVLALGIGVSTLLVADSPYDANADVDRTPVAPERPAQLNETSVSDHVVAYERTRLFNDLIASRDHRLDTHDTVVTECNAISSSEREPNRFRVQLECTGGIDDTMRLFEPGNFSYTVTYRLTESETAQIDIRDYPFDGRDTLETR